MAKVEGSRLGSLPSRIGGLALVCGWRRRSAGETPRILAKVEGQRLEVARKLHRMSGPGLRLGAPVRWMGGLGGRGGPLEGRGRALGKGALEGRKIVKQLMS